MARLGAIVTPFVAQVAAGTSLYIPIGVYGTAALLGLIAALSLPIETKGRQMMVCKEWRFKTVFRTLIDDVFHFPVHIPQKTYLISLEENSNHLMYDCDCVHNKS